MTSEPPRSPPSPASDAGHYFDPAPTVASRPRRVPLVLPDVTLDLVTDAGVFAADRVDDGTKYLLLEGPTPPRGARHLLDLGAGYGPIAVTLARRSPDATVWAVEVNDRARDLCRANAADTPNVVVASPADVPAEIGFDGIWSNPPIRIGKPALHDLLRASLDRLTPSGRATLVVQKHLGADSLARWLEGEGWPTRRLGSRQAYRLLDVGARPLNNA
ncbi:hypothetical protein BH24ACT3_BH24ACT3_19590 [soil metagenome]